MRRAPHGFTLIEIAIVLVIVGLLLGGVLKGQELITGARVRNLIAQQDGVKAAFFGFQDRYRALPGDYPLGSANLNCPGGCPNGDGNGRIESPDNLGTAHEEIFVWTHLTAAGFLIGSYSSSSSTSQVSDSNTPRNPYGAYLQLMYDGVYGPGNLGIPGPSKHNLKTGNQVPVEIIAEVDRKVDDGRPDAGAFQYSDYASDSTPPPVRTDCVDPTGGWKVKAAITNCGGATLL